MRFKASASEQGIACSFFSTTFLLFLFLFLLLFRFLPKTNTVSAPQGKECKQLQFFDLSTADNRVKNKASDGHDKGIQGLSNS